jgi:hypothetical protein
MVVGKNLKKGTIIINKGTGMKARVMGKKADGYTIKPIGFQEALLEPDNFRYWEVL